MSHPPCPAGATGPEIQVIQDLHRVADRHREADARRTLSKAVDLIVELIESRKGWFHFDEAWEHRDPPHSEE